MKTALGDKTMNKAELLKASELNPELFGARDGFDYGRTVIL